MRRIVIVLAGIAVGLALSGCDALDTLTGDKDEPLVQNNSGSISYVGVSGQGNRGGIDQSSRSEVPGETVK